MEKLMKTENTHQCPYQIIGKWHIHRGVILYIFTLPDALELILSSGIVISISQKETFKVPCLLPQLAQLIADGADLPMIDVSARKTSSMLPRDTTGGTTGAPAPVQLGCVSPQKEKTDIARPLPLPRATLRRGSNYGGMGR